MEFPVLTASVVRGDLRPWLVVIFLVIVIASWINNKRKQKALRRWLETRQGKPTFRSASTYRSPLLGKSWTGREYSDQTDGTRLTSLGLPILATPDDLARALDITNRQLTWLSSHEEHAHYRTLYLRKKRSSKARQIDAPRPHLKRVQRWVLRNILQAVDLHPSSTAFSPGNSIVTNASLHTGRELVVRFDLESFFPTIRARRVKGLFRSLGYSEKVSILLTNLTTSDWRLPQGAPTSPAIANLVCRRLDTRLDALARRFGAAYTRYADDLTFSGDRDFIGGLKRFIPTVRRIVREEGFRLNQAKTHFARKGAQQRVSGLVVNRQVSVPRTERRRLRAVLHNLSKGKPAKGREIKVRDLRTHLQGRVAFLSQVHPEEASRLKSVLTSLPSTSPEL
jgi:RNA-directed DNA polymerase